MFLRRLSHHKVQNSGKRTERRGAPSPVMHSTAQTRHPALNLRSLAPGWAAGGKERAYVSVKITKESTAIERMREEKCVCSK